DNSLLAAAVVEGFDIELVCLWMLFDLEDLCDAQVDSLCESLREAEVRILFRDNFVRFLLFFVPALLLPCLLGRKVLLGAFFLRAGESISEFGDELVVELGEENFRLADRAKAGKAPEICPVAGFQPEEGGNPVACLRQIGANENAE